MNLSLGGGTGSRTERDALNAASGVLFVAASGNDGADNDAVGSFPCNYDLVNVVCVGASDRNDARAGFSNYGVRTVDLVAPGVEIASTFPGDRYTYMSGTSMAAPHVSGVAALALSRAPGLTVPQLRNALLSSVDVLPALQPVTVTGGRVNAARAVQAAGSAAGSQTGPSTAPPTAPPTGATDTTAPVPLPAQTTTSPPPSPPPPSAPSSAPSAPAPGSATSPPVAAVTATADRTAPGLALSSPRIQRARTLRAKGLRATVNCSEACRLSVELTLDRATARRLGLRSRRVALSSATISRAGRRVVVLRLAAAARARLRGSGRATLRVIARDAAGNRRARSQTIRLRP